MKRVDKAILDAFKREILSVCKKYQLSIIAEDYQVRLEIVPYSEEEIEDIKNMS